MRSAKLLLIFIILSFARYATAQVIMPSHIVKAGFAAGIMPYQADGYYSLLFEIENSTRNIFLSNEFGAGYLHGQSDILYAKFDYKFYPISAIFNNFRYQMLYVSVGPGVYYGMEENKPDRIGLGLFSTAGLQALISNRISLAVEMEMDIVSNFSSGIENPASSNHNFFFTNSFKIGYLFNARSKK